MYQQSEKAWRQKRPSIGDPGSYDVKVIVVEYDKSKAGNPMVIVVFESDKGCARSFFTKNEYGLKALSELKTAAGIAEADPSNMLLGKSLTIVCEWGKETRDKDNRLVKFIEVKRFLPFGAPPDFGSNPAQDSEDNCNW